MVDKITESMPSISNLGGAAQKVEKVGAVKIFFLHERRYRK